MPAGDNTGLHGSPDTLPGALRQAPGKVGAVGTPAGSNAGHGARPGMAWWCGWCVIAGVSAKIRREVVVESGASIDGSLLYGDLPALDGARDDTHSLSSPGECEGALRSREAHVDGTGFLCSRLSRPCHYFLPDGSRWIVRARLDGVIG
jgi:hypothetical protein